MGSVYKGLIEYRGIDTCINNDLNDFKQYNYENTFHIPKNKPDIEKIDRVDAKVYILKSEVVETLTGSSIEGQSLTGYKLLLSGDVEYKIRYKSYEGFETLYMFTKKLPFYGYVAIPESFNHASYITPAVLIEDVSVKKIENRCLYANITILLVAYSNC